NVVNGLDQFVSRCAHASILGGLHTTDPVAGLGLVCSNKIADLWVDNISPAAPRKYTIMPAAINGDALFVVLCYSRAKFLGCMRLTLARNIIELALDSQ